MNVARNLEVINQRIASACERSGRNHKDIQLIAVTKYVRIPRMQETALAGISHFAENRLQDALPKLVFFPTDITWHYVGHLQTNKVKEVLPRFDYIHSLDRIKLADELAKQAEKLEIRPKCFIQVNVSGEESKYGIEPEELFGLAEAIRDTGIIDIVGLMTMAPYTDDPEETRPVFRKLKELQIELLQKGWPSIEPHNLSMGMSNDFEIAIEEGSTHIRIGTALVGNESANQ